MEEEYSMQIQSQSESQAIYFQSNSFKNDLTARQIEIYLRRSFDEDDQLQNSYNSLDSNQQNEQNEQQNSHNSSDSSEENEQQNIHNSQESQEENESNTSQQDQQEIQQKDAIKLSKKGKRKGDLQFTAQECRVKIANQLAQLNKDYKYKFVYEEKPDVIQYGKKMTRSIYLQFKCNKCRKINKWRSIAGTFQITFRYQSNRLIYHVQIFKSQCRVCKKYMQPFVYQTQMNAMEIFFSVIITNIIDDVPPPKRLDKYYIKNVHWHKSQLCQACKLGRCTTQKNP